VESESESSWRHFLSQLKAASPCIDHEGTVIMGDRDKGLIATDDEIPRVHHLYCVEQHIGRNIKEHFTKGAQEAFKSQICAGLWTRHGLDYYLCGFMGFNFIVRVYEYFVVA
jgi:hypothetical protein